MAIHDALLDAVHVQPAEVVIVTEPAPPAAPTVELVALSAYEQPDAWLTAMPWPATVKLELLAGPVFAATEKPTVPLPEPLAPEVTDSHDALGVADHEQPVPAVTVNEPVAPAAPGDELVGDTAKLHAATV